MRIAELFTPGGPEFRRQIERDYHLRMTAKNTEDLKTFQEEALKVQSELAVEILRAVERSAEVQSVAETSVAQMGEYLTALVGGMEQVNVALGDLNTTANETLDAVSDLSNFLETSLRHISGQIIAQQKTLDDIAAVLQKPYQMRARELRREAHKWLLSGMERGGREQDEDWKDAMRLLKSATDNPIGMQDYVAFFEIGWLLWKHDSNLVAAEDAFYRAQRLSESGRDLYHVLSLRHLSYMQFQLERYQDAYRTIHRALVISRDHDIMYDAARCAAKIGREQEVVDWLDQCIDMQATTIITIFSEPAFRLMLMQLEQLAARKLKQVRKRVDNKLDRCKRVFRGAADAEKLLALELVCLRACRTEIEGIVRRLEKADYITALATEERVLKVHGSVVAECTRAIQVEIEARRSAVARSELTLSQIRAQSESLLANANREGNALVEKARVQADTENRRVRLALQKSEADYAETIRDSKVDPSGADVGLGCLTHLIVLMAIVYLVTGGLTVPSHTNIVGDVLYTLWLLGGWVLFIYLYARLSMQSRNRAAENKLLEERRAGESAEREEKRAQEKARVTAENLLTEAKARAEAEFTARFSSLRDGLRVEQNRVSQAESVLSTFLAVR